MRAALFVLAAALAACGGAEFEFDTYELGSATRVATHCAVADPVLRGPDADALPQLSQTEPNRVRNVLAESKVDLLTAYDAVDARVVPRNGDVWSGPAAIIRQAEDALIVVELSGDALCPTAPTSWNGVPLAFFREGYLD